MAGVGTAIAAPMLAAINLASDAQETFNKFGAVFREQTTAADEFAKTLAGQTGRSVHDLRDAMAAFGSSAVGLGFDRSEAREMSEQLTALAVDMASFHNLDTEDAFNRMRSAMAGSSEVLDRFGINIRASALATKGITSSSTEAEKAMARLQIIAETLGEQGAIGDAARTADQFANASRALITQLKDLAIEIGTTLLPAAEAVVNTLRPVVAVVAAWVKENPKLVATVALVALGLTAAGIALIGFGTGISLISTAVGVATSVLMALSGPLVFVGAAAVGLGMSMAASADLIGDAWSAIVDKVKSGDLTGAMEVAKATALALWRGFGLDLAAIWVEIESTGKKVWATLTEFAASQFEIALGLFRRSVFGLVDLLLAIPGAEELLESAGRSREDIRATGEQIFGKEGEGFGDRVGRRMDEIDKEREEELNRIGEERAALEADLQATLDSAKAESGIDSVSDDVKDETKSAGDGIDQYRRDKASLARSTTNAFAAARAANVSSVRRKDTAAEKTAKATQETADNTQKMVEQNKTSSVGLPVVP